VKLWRALLIVGVAAIIGVTVLRLAAPLVVMHYENQALQNTLRHNENLRFNCAI